jgi:hypothetical protein
MKAIQPLHTNPFRLALHSPVTVILFVPSEVTALQPFAVLLSVVSVSFAVGVAEQSERRTPSFCSTTFR